MAELGGSSHSYSSNESLFNSCNFSKNDQFFHLVNPVIQFFTVIYSKIMDKLVHMYFIGPKHCQDKILGVLKT